MTQTSNQVYICDVIRTPFGCYGGDMVGTHAGDMIGEIALAIEMRADAVDIGKTIHPHPTLGAR
jgi:pyruvate/2-oxoglutarate dehydrogenase complex dihydrolipoamide dehydrogenase (E3) component